MLVGVVIGSGIFRVPSVVAQEVGSVGGAALVWLAGGLITLCGALTVAELSIRFPQPGGLYVFLREAYGPFVAFLFGWIKLLVTGPAALAAISLIFAAYLRSFVPLGERQVQLVAAGLIIALTAGNIRSVRWTAALQNVSTLAKVLGLAAFVVLLLIFGRPEGGALAAPMSWTPASWGGFGVALIAVLWTYTGWVDLTYLAGEVKDPKGTFPKAMAGGLGLVIALYLVANAAYLLVLPMEQVARSDMVAARAAELVFGEIGRSLVALLVLVSTFGSLNGTILANPRVFYAMARDGLFFRRVTAVHPRFKTPYVALLLYMGLGVLGVTTRTFEQLAQIFVFGIWPFYALGAGAVFVLRSRKGEVSPRLRTRWFPLLPAAFIVASVAMLTNGIIQRPVESALSLGILILGVPAFFTWRLLQRRWSGRSARVPAGDAG